MPKSSDLLFVESVAYQEALPQMLELHGINANAVKPKGDKRTRLSLTSTSIKSGVIKFPRQGCEDLIQQLVGFGVEKHDDLADAFSLLINSTLDKIMEESTWIMASLDGIHFSTTTILMWRLGNNATKLRLTNTTILCYDISLFFDDTNSLFETSFLRLMLGLKKLVSTETRRKPERIWHYEKELTS